MKLIEPEKGKFLISAPNLGHFFRRTVIYLVEHNENGSVGFVLNKPTKFKISDVVDDFPDFDAEVHLGGPVQTELINFLHKRGDIIDGGYEIENGIFWGGNFEKLKLLAGNKELNSGDFLFFLGYAGWSANQLNDELKTNSWFVNNADKKIVFSRKTENMWQEVLKNMGGEYLLISTFPEDPSVN
ncbi:YqgE/AlgH family protein [bacterium]|nr:MAG: YqgE/AlgH family protein [bacterium]